MNKMKIRDNMVGWTVLTLIIGIIIWSLYYLDIFTAVKEYFWKNKTEIIKTKVIKWDSTLVVEIVTANPTSKQMGRDSLTMSSGKKIRIGYLCQDRFCAVPDTIKKLLNLKFGDKIVIEENYWFSGWWDYEDNATLKKKMRVEIYLPIGEKGNLYKNCKIRKLKNIK